MNTLRRRLVILSAPVAVVLVLIAVKAASVGVLGQSAAADFASRDTDALRGDVAGLTVWNVAEPARAFFAAGTLAVIDGRLEDADEQFATSLTRSDPGASCPVRVNLEIVRETLGDRAAASFDGEAAVEAYRAAAAVVTDAPANCFAGNTDVDQERRALREDAANRLQGKIAAARSIPPAPAQPPPASPPPPSAVTAGALPDESETRLRLDPTSGDPLDRLQQILRDAAAAGQ